MSIFPIKEYYTEGVWPTLSTLVTHAVPIKIATHRGRRQTHFYQSNIHTCPVIACSQYTVYSKGIATACRPVAGVP